jgi:hypothetical protein
MKALILALLSAATSAAHAQKLEVFESHGTMHYAMVPANKADDTQYMESVAYKFCQDENKGSCRVMIWSDSLDKPTGNPFHSRYDENRLAEYLRGYGGADGMRFNCKLVKAASRCYQR